MAKLLIVYHSRTGNTEEMAKAVSEGAVSSGATVSLKKVAEATVDDLLTCDAVVFGTPTNFGYMAGVMKEFFDQVWLTIGDKPANKPYCAFTSKGGGEEHALDSIHRICGSFNRRKQLNFTKVLEDMVATRRPTPEVLEECRTLGRKMAQL